jgi:TonB family protein
MEQPIVRLNFTCIRNWEDMIPVENGRFCNDCQKKVIDFTGRTNDEIAAYLMSSTTKVCGRFTGSQLAPAPLKPLWKRWLSTAAMVVAVFIGVKEASAQKAVPSANIKRDPQKDYKGDPALEIADDEKLKNVRKFVEHEPYSFASVEVLPSFPGGDKGFASYIHKNIHVATGTKGRVIVSCVVEKNGTLTNIKVLRGVNTQADQETANAMKKSPRWKPAIKNGKAVSVSYIMPVYINK